MKFSPSLRAYAACASLLTSLLGAAAQEAATPASGSASDGFLPASWSWGNWRGFVTLTGQLRYDDNILQTGQHPISDLITVGIPSLNMDYMPPLAEGSMVAHVDYAPQFVGYLSHPHYDAMDQLANAKIEGTYGLSQFKAWEHYSLTTQPEIELIGLTEMEDQATDLSGGYDLTPKTTLSLAPHQEWSRVENAVTVWEEGASVELTHHQSEKLDLKGSYFGARVEAFPGIGAFRQSGLVGVSWEATGRSRLNLNVGFQTMGYDGNRASSGSVTPDFKLDWNWQASEKTSVRLAAGYETDFSKYVAYQVNKTISGELILSHALTRRIGLEVRGRWVLLDQTSVLESTANGGELEYWGAGCGAVYHLNRRTDISLNYDRQERGRNEIYTRYVRDLVQISIQFRF